MKKKNLRWQKLIAEISEYAKRDQESELEAVRCIIQMGHRFVKLKQQIPGRWLVELDKLGFSSRVATRYLTIGTHWSEDGTPGSDLLRKMPRDLHKLEWLVRLKHEDLARLVGFIDCRDKGRGDVKAAVKKRLGLSDTQKALSSVDQLTKCNQLLKGVCTKIGSLDPSDDAASKTIVEEIYGELEAIRNALVQVQNPWDDEESSVEDDDSAYAEASDVLKLDAPAPIATGDRRKAVAS